MCIRVSSCLLLGLVVLGWAQECRLVPVTPFVPANRVEEGESALASQTFATSVSTVSPGNELHFVDSVNRIRRLGGDGRLRSVAGNGQRGVDLSAGLALETALPTISQLLFSRSGELHFVSVGRVWKVAGPRIELVAGTGRPGFNGERNPAQEVNLGGIVNIDFDLEGRLLIVDSFNRVRRLDGDGWIRTIAGSTRIAAANGLTGDEGPAVEAALSNPRQVVVLPDGRIWIRDLGGRHLREIGRDGVIDTIQASFDTGVSIMKMADGQPAAVTANRLLPIRNNGQLETGANPYPAFTGTPRAIAPNGALFFEGSARPEQRTPMVRLAGGQQQVVASAPAVVEVDGIAPPYAAWRAGSLLYASSLGDKAGILEARPGQSPRFVVGGGSDIGDAEGKSATSLTIFGVQAFTVDGSGRIIVADVYRKRILVVENDGKVGELKGSDGQPIVFGPLGTFSGWQRIAADAAGNIYWYVSGGTPTGGVFTADVRTWTRSDRSVRDMRIVGLNAISRLSDGSVAAIAGNGANFRNVLPLSPGMVGAARADLKWLPLVALSKLEREDYFVASSRLFRGTPGRLEYFDTAFLPSGTAFTPDFVLTGGDHLYLHLASDSGFYRLEGVNSCTWTPQPKIVSEGVRNAASFGDVNRVSPRQLVTIFGTGLGPAEGYGIVLDGNLRAGGQPAPYPTLFLGNFSGNIPIATLSGNTLPVVYSNDAQVTVQVPQTTPASSEYLLYFPWQGLQLVHPETVRVAPVTPGIFASSGIAAAWNEDGTLHGSGERAAKRGSVLQIYATGLGGISGTLGNAEFAPLSPLLPTTATVQASLGGLASPVLFSGLAPGLLGGIYQVNLRVPEDASTGELELRIEVGGVSSPAVKVWVR